MLQNQNVGMPTQPEFQPTQETIYSSVEELKPIQIPQVSTNPFFNQNLPDLTQATPAPIDFNSDYWTPVQVGERRRMYFSELKEETSIDMQSGVAVDLVVAYFIEINGGIRKMVRNASKRLVGVIETFNIETGTPLEITYLGKQKNKNNSYLSDAWSVKPLQIQ